MDESGGSGRPQSEHAPARAEDAPPGTSRPAPDQRTDDDPRPSESQSSTTSAASTTSPKSPEPDRGTGEDPGATPGTPTAPADDAAPAHVGTPVSVRKEHPTDGDGAAERPETAPPVRAHAHHSGEPIKEEPKNPGGGLLMGRPFGVPVYVAPSWFLVAALITWVFGGQLDRVLPELGGVRYLVSLFFAVAFYASVLVHELAHTVAALRFKLPVRRIQLQFFGGVSEIEKESETPGREFVLAFVGPLLSLVLAGLFYAGMQAVEPGTVPGVLLAGLMISNLIVAAFNLLPGLPLDGGRMLRAVVWKITGKPMSGTIAAAWVGRALAISVLVGLPILNHSGALGGDTQDIGGMDTVTDALLAAILAAIIWTGAGNSLRMARLREHLPELRARALTRRAVPVETDTPLSEALRRANAAGARALVVVDADGDPLSVVREAAIVGVPEHRRPWVAVSGLAHDITEGMRIPAELAGEELLDRLRSTPATEYLVVETSGEIYGVLSAADVERAFVKAMARPN
ncbi:site-2 protease family protein [Streptomyces aureoverticillatus]|uniref:site-2 protease family protein n=1 Tax=Streptomyces aureoverticillatus TaxID=66871 RepID=UPI0013DC50DE|nr:site-2 protease family protein [Streptomyces aureoverticillatus]QIB46763.1 peptidase [Streptomyces aureoverticillatus]